MQSAQSLKRRATHWTTRQEAEVFHFIATSKTIQDPDVLYTVATGSSFSENKYGRSVKLKSY